MRAAAPLCAVVALLTACAGEPMPSPNRVYYRDYLQTPSPTLEPDACPIPVRWGFADVWAREDVNGRLGCPIAPEQAVSGTMLHFGPEARIIWLRELGQFQALAGSAWGKRVVVVDESGLASAPPARSPITTPPPPGFALFQDPDQYYVPEEGRFGWLLDTHPELLSDFPAAVGDETPFAGVHQPFAHGALLYDGCTSYVLLDDQGGWWMMI